MECEHFVQKTPDILPNTKGCQECEVEKTPWVAIRMCLTCGHVGCCDSSVGRHATKHFEDTGHVCNGNHRIDSECTTYWINICIIMV